MLAVVQHLVPGAYACGWQANGLERLLAARDNDHFSERERDQVDDIVEFCQRMA